MILFQTMMDVWNLEITLMVSQDLETVSKMACITSPLGSAHPHNTLIYNSIQGAIFYGLQHRPQVIPRVSTPTSLQRTKSQQPHKISHISMAQEFTATTAQIQFNFLTQ